MKKVFFIMACITMVVATATCYAEDGCRNRDVGIGVIKGFFFGGAIALISCYKGFTCKEGAQGVGQACTEAFVASFISILALDFALAVIAKGVYATFWPIKSLVA